MSISNASATRVLPKAGSPWRRLLAVVLFAWGTLWAVASAYFATEAILEPANPLRGEFELGVAIALVYGSPSWLGLPIAAWLNRRKHPKVAVVLCVPVVIMMAALATVRVVLR